MSMVKYLTPKAIELAYLYRSLTGDMKVTIRTTLRLILIGKQESRRILERYQAGEITKKDVQHQVSAL